MQPTILPSKAGWKKTLRNAPEPVFLLYVFGFMLHALLVQQYIYLRMSEKEGLPYEYSGHKSSCDKVTLNDSLKLLQEKVQAKAAYFHIGQTMCTTVPSVVICLFLGTWSDNVGRKPVITIGLLGAVLESIFAILTMYFKFPLYLLYVGGFFNGIGGYFTGLILALMSYIADTTEKEKRALRLGVLEAVVFTGAMLSYFVSGFLISAYGFKQSYIIVVTCMVAAFLYSIFILPESLPNPNRKMKNIFGKVCIKYPKRVWQVLTKPRPGRWKIGYMLAATLLVNMLTMGVSQVVTLYVLNRPFCLPSIDIGFFIGTRFMLLGIGAAFGIKIFGKCMNEYSIAFIGLLSYAAFYILLAFAKSKLMLYLACFGGCISGTCGPIFRGILSKAVGADEQGSLFSAVASLEMLFVFLGSFLFNAFYPFVNKHGHPGATFSLLALLLLIPFILNIIYIVKIRKEMWKNKEDVRNIIVETTDENDTMKNVIDSANDYGSSHNINS